MQSTKCRVAVILRQTQSMHAPHDLSCQHYHELSMYLDRLLVPPFIFGSVIYRSFMSAAASILPCDESLAKGSNNFCYSLLILDLGTSGVGITEVLLLTFLNFLLYSFYSFYGFEN